VPAAQFEQLEDTVAPVVARNLPAAQLVHTDAPAPAHVPVRQLEQTLAPELADMLPPRQEEQLEEAVAPEVGKYLPAAQLLQLVDPEVAW